jgi:hypothetical protein
MNKSVVREPPKFKTGKQPAKDGIIECTQIPPPNRLADLVGIGFMILIGTGAILGILDALPKKDVTHQLDAPVPKVQNMPQDAAAVESKAANADLAATGTSGYPSSLPIQSLLIEGLPGSPYQAPLTRKPALRRFGPDSHARGWRLQRELADVAQKLGYARDSKRKWPKAFIMYLEAHRDFLRKIRRHSETTSSNTRE